MEITIAKDNNDTENREKNGDVREDRTRKRKEKDDDREELARYFTNCWFA